MSTELDPELREVDAIRRLGQVGEAHTLEIGCGDGRLAARLRSLTSEVTGVDPSLAAILGACSSIGRRLLVADARSLPFHNGRFDQAVFGWSL